MELKKLFTTIYSIVIILLITLGAVAIMMYRNNQNLVQSNVTRFNSFSIANELKQSSDDMTKYCRTYVETGDSIWENKYWETLDIRNGKKQRPDGRTFPLIDSMKKMQFTEVEFAKLNEAEHNSNNLVWTEKIAFHAAKGLFADSAGQFSIQKTPDTAFARSILYNTKYNEDKSTIMNPIEDFIAMVKQRKQTEVHKYTDLSKLYLSLIMGLILIISVISINYFFLIKNKIIKQLIALKESEQKQRELNATKQKLFSIIAHDLRSPFNSMLGFSDLLIANIKDADYENALSYSVIINSTATNTLVLLDNLLNWGKSQIEKTNFSPEKINLSEILGETINTMNSIAIIKNISINFILPDDIEAYGDQNMLKTVLRNLISNAIKFTNTNGKIAIGAVQKQTFVEISITDNGVGMNEETRNKLFRLETNESTIGTADEKGTGLGLILCKEFVEKQGGQIWVESEAGKGSVFKFTIPRYKS